MDDKKIQLLYGDLISKCWKDDSIKQEFICNTVETLKNHGFPIEENVEYVVIEDSETSKHITFPKILDAEMLQTINTIFTKIAEQKQGKMIPEGGQINIIQNTENVRYLVIPIPPKTNVSPFKTGPSNGLSSFPFHDINFAVEANVVAIVNIAGWSEIAAATTAAIALYVVPAFVS